MYVSGKNLQCFPLFPVPVLPCNVCLNGDVISCLSICEGQINYRIEIAPPIAPVLYAYILSLGYNKVNLRLPKQCVSR